MTRIISIAPSFTARRAPIIFDNAERFCEFSRAAIEFTKRVWMPDVIHCHDWQTALVPVLLRTQYARDPALKQMGVVFTIHNLGYQGLFPHSALARIGLPETLFHVDALEFFGKVNFLKGGLIYSDRLTTVSKKYAAEIQTKEYRLRSRRRDSHARGPAYRNSEWSGLFRVEPGSRQTDRGKLFGAQSRWQARLQEGSARTIQAAG